jgi:hypothetical protein
LTAAVCTAVASHARQPELALAMRQLGVDV